MLRSVRLGILLLSVELVLSVDNYKKLGDEAVLSPGSVSDPIISIIWIHGSNIAVEWYKTETVVHRDFRDRCKLNFSTGALTISNLTVKDSGVYTAEINNKVMSPTEITVISAVPKPTVSAQCSSEGTRCTFTCEASITGAEPVTYSWVIGAKQIPQSSSNQLSITKDDAEIVGKPIRCQVKNPVSSARSEDVIIPFTNVDTDNYKKLGGEAVLSPSSVSDRISSITWKHGPDIAVEWYGQEIVSYREFRGRCKLDFKTGALTISNLTVKDSGVYTAEINNRVMSPSEITVISAVPKPTVSTQCSSEGTRCTFTCEANVIGTEPVTYSWMVNGKNITGSSKSLEKEKDDPEMVGKPIRCQLENPVSSERSDDVIIPFTNGDFMDANVGGVVAFVAFVFVFVVACGVVFICYSYRRRSQNLNEDMSAVKLSNTDMKTPGTALTVMVDQAPARTVPETQKKMLTSTNPASVWISQLKGKRRDCDHKTISTVFY